MRNVAEGLVDKPMSSEQTASLAMANHDESRTPIETEHSEGNPTLSFDPLKISTANRKEDKTINDETQDGSILSAQTNVSTLLHDNEAEIQNNEDESQSPTDNNDNISQRLFFQVLTGYGDDDETTIHSEIGTSRRV